MPEATSGIPLPIGYDQNSLQSYYQSLLEPINQRTSANEGTARGNALARGLEGTPTETGGVAAADYFGGLEKSSTLSNLAFNMAGLSNQDALIKQQQDWQANESNLQRQYGLDYQKKAYDYAGSLQKQAAGFGFTNQANLMAMGNNNDMNAGWTGFGLNVAGKLLTPSLSGAGGDLAKGLGV